MVLIAGTVFAWAVSLRLLSEALFALLACWLNIWLSLGIGLLGLLGIVPSGEADDAQQHLQQPRRRFATLEHTAHKPHEQQQERQLVPAADTTGHIHSWVESAALHATHCRSPRSSNCSSIISPPAASKEPFSLQSSSNGSSGSTSTSQVVSTAIAKAAAERMLQAYQTAGGGLHEAAPAAVAVWATSHLLAQRVSGAGTHARGRRVSAAYSLPPLEYEASAELQQELEAAAPDEFMCPLGRVLMVDPVFTPSGFTYHRPCILEWIDRTGRDPALDGCPLSPGQLCPNVNLRDQVATWLQRQGVEC